MMMSVYAMFVGGVLLGALLSLGRKLNDGAPAALGMALLLPLCFVMKIEAAVVGMLSIMIGSVPLSTGLMTRHGNERGTLFDVAVSLLLIWLIMPHLSRFAASLNGTETLALGAFIAAAAVRESSGLPRGAACVALGMMISFIGIDLGSGAQRYSFWIDELYGGVDFSVAALGLCCVGEIMFRLVDNSDKSPDEPPAPVGGVAREIGALVPALAFGMPYTLPTVILAGMFAMYGQSLPGYLASYDEMLRLALMAVAGAAMFRVLLVDGAARKLLQKFGSHELTGERVTRALMPAYMTAAFVGAYMLNYRVFDMFLLFLFGVLGCVMRMRGFSAGLLLMGMVMGPKMEQAFRAPLEPTWFVGVCVLLLAALFTLKRFGRKAPNTP